MKKILPLIIIGVLVISGFGTIAIKNNQNLQLKTTKTITQIGGERDFTHTVLGEFGTATWCGYCKYGHTALKNLYADESQQFYYISMVGDKNNNAYNRIKNDYNLYGYPTVWWDGGYDVDVGAGSTEGAMSTYNSSINLCGSKSVNDIDLSLDVEWLGPDNPNPTDGSTDIPIENCLSWTNSEMMISVSVTNNEGSTYGGTLRTFVTEVESSMGWLDTFGNPYTFSFLDFAFEEDLSINSGQTWEDDTYWDGKDFNDGYGNDFSEITQENIMVIAAVFDDEVHTGYSYPPEGYPFDAYYVDDSIGILAGVDTDPKSFDVYFGESSPPPKVSSNQTDLEYCPSNLEFNKTYYWQIVLWDALGTSITGPIWSFTTRENNPPNSPSDPNPADGETQVSIDSCISWTSEDPDGDNVTFDVYCGDSDPPPLVSSNQTDTIFCPEDVLNFDTIYYWRVDAWDQYGELTNGALWYFRTEQNYPPYTPSNPDPPDGSIEVSITKILKWTGGDPNEGDVVKYDVYFGTESPPPLVAEDLLQEAYDPGEMDVETIYYWQIVSEDSMGEITNGPSWYFTTEEEHNYPPTAPDIDGPIRGPFKEELCWTFHSDDQNGHYIRYNIDWGDESSETTLYYEPCTPKEICHTYDLAGTYIITATAEDEKGLFSTENTFDIIIPRNRAIYNSLLYRLFERFLNENLLLKYILGIF
jgi:hypothetical protein